MKYAIIAIVGIIAFPAMLWKEFGGYVRDVSPDNFIERTDKEWQ
ncbi:hypothetical protein [Jingyaoa shaoxingensis]|nr:hypothetical protein [Jingyaoa shaoxingensis]